MTVDADVRDLYQQVILDHNRNPRNFGPLAGADRTVEGFNPLCGDHYTVYLRFEGDRVAEVRFTGAGCAISKASASVMTDALRGRTRDEAAQLFDLFQKLITGKADPGEHLEELGKLAAFSGVSEFPARVKCAGLAWHTMHAALRPDGETTVSTE
jgi:nitrogen fixation NifU-like protein